jgi:hypothetical protein
MEPIEQVTNIDDHTRFKRYMIDKTCRSSKVTYHPRAECVTAAGTNTGDAYAG